MSNVRWMTAVGSAMISLGLAGPEQALLLDSCGPGACLPVA